MNQNTFRTALAAIDPFATATSAAGDAARATTQNAQAGTPANTSAVASRRAEQHPQKPRDAVYAGYYETMVFGAHGPKLQSTKPKAQRIGELLQAVANEMPACNFTARNGVPLATSLHALRTQGPLFFREVSAPGPLHDAAGELLVFASMLGASDAVAQLLAAGVTTQATDLFGNTALHWALLAGYPDVKHSLLQHGASNAPLNSLFAQPSDYAATFGPEIPCAAYMEKNGVLVARSASQIQDELGFLMTRDSAFGVDAIVSFALSSFCKERGVDAARSLPAEPQLVDAAATLTLKHFDDMGWGVCASEAMPRGTFLGSYTGDLVHQAETTSPKSAAELSYVLNLFEERYEQSLSAFLGWDLDGATTGGIVTRFNSSDRANRNNVRLQLGVRRGRPVVDFYTKCAVPMGEQLVWYYGQSYWNAMGSPPKPLSAEHNFFWADDRVIGDEQDVLDHLRKDLQHTGTAVFFVDTSKCLTPASLLGTSTRPGLFHQAISYAANRSLHPHFVYTYLHEANSQVQHAVDDILLNRNEHRDAFTGALFEPVALIGTVSLTDRTALPKTISFRKNE